MRFWGVLKTSFLSLLIILVIGCNEAPSPDTEISMAPRGNGRVAKREMCPNRAERCCKLDGESFDLGAVEEEKLICIPVYDHTSPTGARLCDYSVGRKSKHPSIPKCAPIQPGRSNPHRSQNN